MAPGKEVPVTVQNYLDDVTHDGYLFAQLTRPVELASSDPGQASAWLDQGLPFATPLSAPPAGWQLEGVRIWHTVSRLSALVEMTDGHGEHLLLFAVPAAEITFDPATAVPTSQGPVYPGQGWGYQAVAWKSGDLAWSAVSTLPRERLLSWLKAYRASS